MRLTKRVEDKFGNRIVPLYYKTDDCDIFRYHDDAYRGLEKLARYEDVADEPELISLDKVFTVIEAVRRALEESGEGELGRIFDKGYYTACDAIQTRIKRLAE